MTITNHCCAYMCLSSMCNGVYTLFSPFIFRIAFFPHLILTKVLVVCFENKMTLVFEDLMRECQETFADVVAWRRHIHANPELSNEEDLTAEFIHRTLRSFECKGLSLTHPVPTSVVATLKGGAGDGPLIGLRADIDALPLTESADLPFKSTKPGVMHACGHDAHTAMLLGAAKILCKHYKQLRGGVRFIFQHAEEKHPGGASVLCDRGVMKGVQRTFAIHVAPQLPCGVVGIRPGICSSCSDSFTVVIKGKGGHASMPHELVDPVPIAAEVVLGLQTIVSRRIDAKKAPVLSIATMTTGPNETHNVIPDTVKLMGTIRSHYKDTRAIVPAEIERVVKGITQAYNADYVFNLKLGYDMVDNDPALTEEVSHIMERVMGGDKTRIFVPKEPSFGGEDYSAYQRYAPGVMIGLGVGNIAEGITAPLHSSEFRLDEDGLVLGVCGHVGFVFDNLVEKL